ncbi:MAG: GTP 3',8-cyclase MoaA, partial [Myxococcales bacterium]|nr:GTP 3',8-cyclase MoaA [Myxococcales bacterium]
YRCTYCMPAEGFAFLPRPHLLTFEELKRIVGVLVGLGIRKIRLTGGEPLIRRDISVLIAGLARIEGVEDLAMTTNAHRLGPLAQGLADAGLRRVNVSLDDVDPDVFRDLTRGGDLAKVLDGIARARAAGLGVKLNAVVVAGVNDDAPLRIVRHFADQPEIEIRFIETMPFERVDRSRRHVSARSIREQLGELEPLPPPLHAGPATRFRLPSGQVVGFVSPITEHFCQACNRLRLQADGHLRTCLSREAEPSLRDVLRSGIDDTALEQLLRRRVWGKVAGHEAHLDGEGFRSFDGAMTSVGG